MKRTLSETASTAGGLAENSRATSAQNDGLGVAEDGGHLEAACGKKTHQSVKRTEKLGKGASKFVPGHLTSIKYELGLCTRRLSLCLRFSAAAEGCRRSLASYEITVSNTEINSIKSQNNVRQGREQCAARRPPAVNAFPFPMRMGARQHAPPSGATFIRPGASIPLRPAVKPPSL